MVKVTKKTKPATPAAKAKPIAAKKETLTAAPEKKKNKASAYILMFIIMVLAVGGFYTYHEYSLGLDEETETEQSDEIREVSEKPAKENYTTDELNKMYQLAAAGLVELNKRIDEVEKNAIRISDYQDYNAKLSARMDDVEKYNKNNRGEAMVLLTSIMQLRMALDTSSPFETELEAVKTVGGQHRVIADFTKDFEFRSKTGIKTYADLADEFKAVRTETMREYIKPTSEGFWGKLWYNLAPVIKVRRTAVSEEENTVPALLLKIERKLTSKEYASALELTKMLEDMDNKTYARLRLFEKDLQDRQDISKKLSEVTAYALSLAENSKQK